MKLGKLGVWVSMDSMTAAAAAAFARRVEEWGYAALWIPESRGRNALTHSSWLLANTPRLIVATGIANIYAREPNAMANGQRGVMPPAAVARAARPHLRQACRNHARLPGRDAQRALSGTDAKRAAADD